MKKLVRGTMKTKEELIKYLKENALFDEYLEIRDRFDTYEKCLTAVKQTGDVLRFVDASALTNQQYYDVCLAAVKQSGHALQFVSALAFGELYYDVCLAAVKQNGLALLYADASVLGERYYDVCLAAVKQDRDAVSYIKNRSDSAYEPINLVFEEGVE